MKTKTPIYLFILSSPFVVGGFALLGGAYNISPWMILKILFDGPLHLLGGLDIPERAIILDIRLPRIILAGLVGIALAGSGVTLQGIFRNPLVDPFILGISAGAALGCALSVGFFPHIPIQLLALSLGIVAVILTYTVARTQGEVLRLSLVLSGIVISAFFTAMVSIVKVLVDPERLHGIVFWLMGSFSLADWNLVKIAGIGITAGILPIFLMRWRLNAMSMGESEAKALGVNVKRERMIFIVSSSLATSVAVSVSGIIGWVGLMVPHLVRMTVGPDHKDLVPLSMAGGAAFMIFADTIARGLTGFDIPVGIITAITGAPFFIYLMKRGGRESWGR
ncbi:MAG: FecCD family ABC transporter permease [Dissulfurimicrobium sp.]|uniref:FecCD family ABC transporter permease n=1 Tax=Dissulfurimicrobium sp. TaxID=2022436 RepID=UPI00404B7D35